MFFIPAILQNWLIGKDPDAGKDWRQEEKGTTGDEMFGWLTDSMDMSLSKLWELVMDREGFHAALRGVAKSQTRQGDWTELMLQKASTVFAVTYIVYIFHLQFCTTHSLLDTASHTWFLVL